MNEPTEMKSSATENQAAQQPVKVVRRGVIAASVWKRQTPSGFPYYDFSLSRSWKSLSNSKTANSKNFFADHAKELAEVIQETAAWIEARQGATPTVTTPEAMAA